MWHADHVLAGEAIGHAVAAGVFGRAAELIEQHFDAALAVTPAWPAELAGLADGRLSINPAWSSKEAGDVPESGGDLRGA